FFRCRTSRSGSLSPIILSLLHQIQCQRVRNPGDTASRIRCACRQTYTPETPPPDRYSYSNCSGPQKDILSAAESDPAAFLQWQPVFACAQAPYPALPLTAPRYM